MDDKNKNDIKKRLEELRRDNNRKRGTNGDKSPFGSSSVLAFIILIVLAFLFFWSGNVQDYFQQKKEINYSEFITKIKNGSIKEIIEKDDKLIANVK